MATHSYSRFACGATDEFDIKAVDGRMHPNDLHATRLQAALRSRLPSIVWAVLFAVAALSFAMMGYHAGLIGTSRTPATLVLAMAFAIVIWLVVDLERPLKGMLRVSQQPMVDLRNSMAAPEPASQPSGPGTQK